MTMKKSQYVNAVISNVRTNGRHITSVVDPEGADPSYFYSVGNSLNSTPPVELICFYYSSFGAILLDEVASWIGEDQRRVDDVLNNGISYVHGFLGEDESVPIVVKHLAGLTATVVYEKYAMGLRSPIFADVVRDHDLLQIILPDREGLFPGQHKCNENVNRMVPEFLHLRSNEDV